MTRNCGPRRRAAAAADVDDAGTEGEPSGCCASAPSSAAVGPASASESLEPDSAEGPLPFGIRGGEGPSSAADATGAWTPKIAAAAHAALKFRSLPCGVAMGEIVRSTGVQGGARVRSLPGAANFSVPAMPVCKCEGPGAGRKSAGLEKSAVVAAERKESRPTLMW